MRQAKTLAQLAIHEEQLRYRAEKFGVADLDRRSKEAKQLEGRGASKRKSKSIGAFLQRPQHYGGYGGRAAARAASAKISSISRREGRRDDDYAESEDEALRQRSRRPKAKSPKKRSGGRHR